MKKIKLRKWDSAEHLNSDEDIALYLDACLEEAGTPWAAPIIAPNSKPNAMP